MGPLTKFRNSLRHALLTNTRSDSGSNSNSNPAKPRRPTRLKKFRWGKNQAPDNAESDNVIVDSRKNAQEPDGGGSDLQTARSREKAQDLSNKSVENGQNAVGDGSNTEQLRKNTLNRSRKKKKEPSSKVKESEKVGKETNQLEATTKQDALPPELEAVQRLGFDITPSKIDHKAIILALVERHRYDVLEYFLGLERRPCDPDLQKALDTALFDLTQRYIKCISTMRALLDSGADPNFRGPFRRTALHNAAERGYDDMVRLLLDRGANIRATDEERKTPLHLAGDQGHESIFLMMHMHLHGNLLHVRREEDPIVVRRNPPRHWPPDPRERLGAYEYPLPGGPADPRPTGRVQVFYHPNAERW